MQEYNETAHANINKLKDRLKQEAKLIADHKKMADELHDNGAELIGQKKQCKQTINNLQKDLLKIKVPQSKVDGLLN